MAARKDNRQRKKNTMADEVVTPEAPEKVTDLVESIGEEGTLASLQSKTARVRFNSDTGGLTEEPTTPPEEQKEAPQAGDKEEAADEAAAAKAAEAAQKKESKFKTKEDAEKSAAEAEKKMHEATTQAAKEKEAREAAERESAELKTKLEEALAKPPEKPVEEAKPLTAEGRKGKVRAATKAALTTIRNLDRAADDYDDKVEEAWAEALLEAGMTGSPLTQTEIDKMVKDSMKEAKRSQEAADAAKAAETANERAWQSALEQGTKAGLSLNDKASVDYRLFDSIERDFHHSGLPAELKDKTLPEVVEYMIKEVRRLTGKVVATTDAERERARKAQINNSVLTKGVTSPKAAAEEPKPYSLAELQRQDRDRMKARQRGA